MTQRTAIYRLFNTEGSLLYIGVTENLEKRLAAHQSTKPWWTDVARHTVRWHETREEALAAEVAAIWAERPMWNVVASPCPPERPLESWIREAVASGEAATASGARSNLTEILESVRILRRVVVLLLHRKPAAAVVPVELADAVQGVGGPDAAIKILRKAAVT